VLAQLDNVLASSSADTILLVKELVLKQLSIVLLYLVAFRGVRKAITVLYKTNATKTRSHLFCETLALMCMANPQFYDLACTLLDY